MRYENAKIAHAALMKFYPFTLEDLPGENWAAVEYDAKHYQISTFGRIKSFYKDEAKILRPSVDKDGYLQIHLHKDGKYKTFKIHYLVGKAFIPNPEGKPEINHKFGNKMDNFVENLEWVTRVENDRHARETGLKKSGGECTYANLTDEMAEWVRQVNIPKDKKYSTKALAKRLGVSETCIYFIIHGKTYKNAGGKKSDDENE